MLSNLVLFRISLAMAASALGVSIMKIAMPTLAGSEGYSTSEIGLVTAFPALAWLLFSLAAGWALDRFGRGGVFRLGLVLVAFAAAALWLDSRSATASISLLCLLALFVGLGEVFTETAGQTILPDLVEKDTLEKGNSWLQGGKSAAAMFLAPFLLATILDFQPVLTFGTTFLVMIVALVVLPGPKRCLETSQVGFAGFFKGAMILSRPGSHRRFSILLAAMTISWGAWMTLIVPYSLSAEHLDLGPTGVGQIMTVMGCGSLVGALAYASFKRVIGSRRLLALDPLASAAFLLVPAFGLGLLPVALSAFLAGIGGVTWSIYVASFQQSSISQDVLGRVVAAYRWLGWIGFLLGSTLSGFVADNFGLQSAFLIFAIPAIIAGMLFCIRSPLQGNDGPLAIGEKL